MDATQDVTPAPDRSPARAVLRLDTTVGHLVRRAQQVHTALWSAEFDGDLTGPQYALLSALSRQPSVDQRSAGRRASLDKSTAADVVARLQRSGWLSRDQDPADGRRKLLSLTGAARTALKQITPRVAEVQQRLLEPLPADQREWLVQRLTQVAYGDDPPTGEEVREVGDALPMPTTPGHLIRRSEQLHGAHWQELVGPTLTPSQYGLLSAVAWQPAVDQSTAGELASLDKSSTADIMARLVRRGFVTISRDERDRRRKVLDLTDRAWESFAEVTPSVRRVQDALLRPLAAGDAPLLVERLHTLAYR